MNLLRSVCDFLLNGFNVLLLSLLVTQNIRYFPSIPGTDSSTVINEYLSSNGRIILKSSSPITIPLGGALELIFAHLFIAAPKRSTVLDDCILANSTSP